MEERRDLVQGRQASGTLNGQNEMVRCKIKRSIGPRQGVQTASGELCDLVWLADPKPSQRAARPPATSLRAGMGAKVRKG